jgi:hypothetical protein
MSGVAPEDSTPPVQSHANQDRPVVTILSGGPTDTSLAGEDYQRRWLEPDPLTEVRDPRPGLPAVIDQPPTGYLLPADMIERVLRRDEPELLARQGLTDSASLRAAVETALSSPQEPEAINRLLRLYEHETTVLARSRRNQLHDLAAGWIAAQSLVWQSLMGRSLRPLAVTEAGEILPVPPRELETNGPRRVFHSGNVIWHDATAPDSGRSGRLVVAKEDFDKWFEAGAASGAPKGHAPAAAVDHPPAVIEILTASRADAPASLSQPAKKRTGPKTDLTETAAKNMAADVQAGKYTFDELDNWRQKTLAFCYGVKSRTTAMRALREARIIVTNSNSDN